MSLSGRSSGPAAALDPGALRWVWLPHPHGQAAQPTARDWLAAQLGDPALSVSRDARQRPHLDPPHAEFDCNWSHSGERLLIALAHRARVGVDLERVHRRPRAVEIARRYFTPAETLWLAGHEDRDRAFLRLWCAKEAVLKAHGHGLSFGLDRLRFEPDADGLRLAECDPELGEPAQWRLQEIVPGPGYLGALAWRAEP
jgi:4'-phosphopantetheinyl transferase